MTDSTKHALQALLERQTELETRVEALQTEVTRLRGSVAVLDAMTKPARPRPDADLGKLARHYGATVIETNGSFGSLRDAAETLQAPSLIHHPKRRALQIYAYARLRREEPLFVVLHGAMVHGTWFPRFEMVRTMEAADRSFCSIADPTVQLDLGMKLGWYLGNDGLDPVDWIEELVAELVQITGTQQLVFVGSSGGGFAALQISRRFAGSLAFVTDPQTDVPSYHEAQARRVLEVGFDGLAPQDAASAFPGRFSAVDSYSAEQPRNFVYYTQHAWDKFHVEHHMTPFARALGCPTPGADWDGDRLQLRMVRRGKHGPLGPEQFESYLRSALEWHRSKLPPSARSD